MPTLWIDAYSVLNDEKNELDVSIFESTIVHVPIQFVHASIAYASIRLIEKIWAIWDKGLGFKSELGTK